jgi:hypothetical protein
MWTYDVRAHCELYALPGNTIDLRLVAKKAKSGMWSSWLHGHEDAACTIRIILRIILASISG